MPKITFPASWSADEQKAAGIEKGYLLMKYWPLWRDRLGKFMLKLDAFQKKTLARIIEKGIVTGNSPEAIAQSLRELSITIEYHCRKRTLDQNALKWALYTIEAHEQNCGHVGAKEQMVQPMELYLADLREYGDIITINDKVSALPQYKADYRVIEAIILDDGREFTLKGFERLTPFSPDDRITIRARKGTSKKDTVEMAIWIERIFNRIAYHGVNITSPEDIERYWEEWRTHLNNKQVILHNDELMTHADYKALNPICEGCKVFIGLEGGEIAHIKGFGMGGDRSREPARDYPWNILHLCHSCHISGPTAWHLGYKTFLRNRPWLRWKVNQALHRDCEGI